VFFFLVSSIRIDHVLIKIALFVTSFARKNRLDLLKRRYGNSRKKERFLTTALMRST